MTKIVAASGVELVVEPADVGAQGALLHEQFNRILEAGEGYPQAGPIRYDEFAEYWLDGKTAVLAAWAGEDRSFAGSYFLKPNGYGRAAHVGNAGYFVVPEWRGRGLGEALVLESFDRARALGFDALQFNFVFETNPARSMYERLGFREVGRVPDVVDGEAVCIYWRSLDSPVQGGPVDPA